MMVYDPEFVKLVKSRGCIVSLWRKSTVLFEGSNFNAFTATNFFKPSYLKVYSEPAIPITIVGGHEETLINSRSAGLFSSVTSLKSDEEFDKAKISFVNESGVTQEVTFFIANVFCVKESKSVFSIVDDLGRISAIRPSKIILLPQYKCAPGDLIEENNIWYELQSVEEVRDLKNNLHHYEATAYQVAGNILIEGRGD